MNEVFIIKFDMLIKTKNIIDIIDFCSNARKYILVLDIVLEQGGFCALRSLRSPASDWNQAWPWEKGAVGSFQSLISLIEIFQ